MSDEPITLSELAAGGVSALNRLRLLIDRTQRAATPMNNAWISLTAEIERALVDQSRDQDALMRDMQTALSLLAKRTEECESLRAQLSEAQARLEQVEMAGANLIAAIDKTPLHGAICESDIHWHKRLLREALTAPVAPAAQAVPEIRTAFVMSRRGFHQIMNCEGNPVTVRKFDGRVGPGEVELVVKSTLPADWRYPAAQAVEVFDRRCNYSALAGQVCSKCGRVHQSTPYLPAAQSVAEDVVRDSERYRFLRDADQSDSVLPYSELLCYAGDSLDSAIDAALLAAQQQKSGGE